MEPEYIEPGEKALMVGNASILTEAETMVIENDQQYLSADNFRALGKEQARKIGEYWDPLIKDAHAMHKNLLAKKNSFLEPLKEANSIVGRKMLPYKKKKEEEAEAERRRLRKIQMDEAEKKQKELDQAKLDEAVSLSSQGRESEAMGVLEAPTPAVVVVAPPVNTAPVPKTKTRYRKDYEVDILDINLVPNEFVKRTANIPAIKLRVKSFDGKVEIPGVIIRETSTPY